MPVDIPMLSTGSSQYALTQPGDGFNGTGPMNFELRDGRIARLWIS